MENKMKYFKRTREFTDYTLTYGGKIINHTPGTEGEWRKRYLFLHLDNFRVRVINKFISFIQIATQSLSEQTRLSKRDLQNCMWC